MSPSYPILPRLPLPFWLVQPTCLWFSQDLLSLSSSSFCSDEGHDVWLLCNCSHSFGYAFSWRNGLTFIGFSIWSGLKWGSSVFLSWLQHNPQGAAEYLHLAFSRVTFLSIILFYCHVLSVSIIPHLDLCDRLAFLILRSPFSDFFLPTSHHFMAALLCSFSVSKL